MQTGSQSARFGKACGSSGPMVAALGQTLCMSREHTRLDRDDWIRFNTDICQPVDKDTPDFSRYLITLNIITPKLNN